MALVWPWPPCYTLTSLITASLAVQLFIGLGLTENELIEQIMVISKRSDGQFISTLQDLRAGRETEIAFLNLEMARMAAALQPSLTLPRTQLLGQLITAKSTQRK